MSGPHPAVAATRVAVRDALAGWPPGPVLVACSGGPDSLALAAATAFVAARTGRAAGAVCVDHGLRDGSAQVAAAAVETCRGLGLDPAVVVEVQVDGPGGPEAAARRARYRALDAAADATGAVAVLLGHTLDDQAEQVLLGLARGSGARSLAGMPPARDRRLRPFLRLRRSQTVAACAALGLRPWADPSDAAGENLRARVRHDVLPVLDRVLGPGVAPALGRTADQLRELADTVDQLVDDLLVRAGDGSTLAVDVLLEAPAGLRRAALRTAALRAGAPAGSLAAAHVHAVDALLTDWHGQGPVQLPGGIVAHRDCGRLALSAPVDPGRPGARTRGVPGARCGRR